MLPHRARWMACLALLLLLLIALLCVATPALASSGDSASDAEFGSEVDLEAEHASDVASELTAAERLAATDSNVLSGEAVSQSEQALFDSVEQQLFGVVHHASDSEAEEAREAETEAHIIAQAAEEEGAEDSAGGDDHAMIESAPRDDASSRSDATQAKQQAKQADDAQQKPSNTDDAQQKPRAKQAALGQKLFGKRKNKQNDAASGEASAEGAESNQASSVQTKVGVLVARKKGAGKNTARQGKGGLLGALKARTSRKDGSQQQQEGKLKNKASNKGGSKGKLKDKLKLRQKSKGKGKGKGKKSKQSKRKRKTKRKPLARHLHQKDSYRLRKDKAAKHARSAGVLRKALERKAAARAAKEARRLEKEKSKLARQRAKDRLAKEQKLKLAKAIKVRQTLDRIESEKQRIAKALYTKARLERQAREADELAQREEAKEKQERARLAAQQLKLMREKAAVQALKAQVAVLADKARSLHARLSDIQSGGKPITTRNVIEDGLGDGRLEDGYSRNVQQPDRQTQKAFDAIVGQVMPDAVAVAGNIQQKNLDGSFPIMHGADAMRNRFQDFKIEMKETRATPEGWPSQVSEAEEIPE